MSALQDPTRLVGCSVSVTLEEGYHRGRVLAVGLNGVVVQVGNTTHVIPAGQLARLSVESVATG